MMDSCSSNSLLSIKDALNRIHSSLSIVSGDESVNLHNALGRVLAENCTAPFNLPAFTNSSMDGYAFNSADHTTDAFVLQKIGISWAGHPYSGKLLPGQCVRIFTGAVIPEGADSVIMQEQVTADNNSIHFSENTLAKQNIRYAGEDVKQQDCLLPAPKLLTAIDIGLLASAGIYEVQVKRKIRIAFLSTGDELFAVGSRLLEGQIYDSNRYLLAALLKDPCYEITDLGVLPDIKADTHQCLLSNAKNQDVIISTGGASVGDADYIKEILDEIGQVNFWKLAIKPGKPLAFGRIGQCYFFGLPGNPISVLATYEQIVTPALHHLSNKTHSSRIRVTALCTSQLFKTPGRQEFQRGILTQTDTGEFEVSSSGKQGSNILSASSRANCYIVLAREQAGVDIGEQVTVEPFSIFL